MPAMPITTGDSIRGRHRPGDATFQTPVDGALTGSVSSPPIDGAMTASSQSRTAPPNTLGHHGHELVAVGPGHGAPALRLAPLGSRPVNPLPVRAAKIQSPLRRADTLSRPRLNGWLDRAAGGRLVLVVGDAGFGKTTLLADWASETSRRTAWYGLEHDDRDWLTLVRHLVAGGREADPGFAPDTYAMLCALGVGGPTQEELTEALAREMAAFGASDAHGFSLILDDYHAIEGSEETEPIIGRLLQATGPGFSVVMSARSAPELPPIRLRGRGAMHRLDGDALRFDVPETESLFREAYHIPLEHDVVVDLVARTEGWAALLSLVRTRLEERPDPDPRALVAKLSATEGDLYDFLASEVLVDLSPDIQDFLARVSILSHVTLRLAQLVDPREPDLIEESIAEAETLGLLQTSDRGLERRFHPLVRDFLAARLEAVIGREELRKLHRAIAEALEASDWLAAARHYRAAGAPDSAARVVDEAIPAIIGSGAFEVALPLLDGTAGSSDRAGALILRSRIEFARGNLARAITLAEAAVDKAGADLAGAARLNIAALEAVAGFPEHAVKQAESALQAHLSAPDRQVAEASLLMRRSQVDGDLAEVADALGQLAQQQEFSGLTRYAAISYLNLASVLNWLGDPAGAVKAAIRAETRLADLAGTVERVAAMAARAFALVQLGKQEEADLVMRIARGTSSPIGRMEAELETAQLETMYGSEDLAEESLERIDVASMPKAYQGFWATVAGTLALRKGDPARALELAAEGQRWGFRDVAGRYRSDLLELRARIALEDPAAGEATAALSALAAGQGSRPGAATAAILRLVQAGSPLGIEVTSLAAEDRHTLSVLAEELCGSLSNLTPSGLRIVKDEARLRPARWRTALRLTVAGSGPSRLAAARLLADIGDERDGAFLREQAKLSRQIRDFAAEATRRLAPKAYLRDLGVVGLELGGIPASGMSRRKSVSLLCFLASRARQAATRDEALEALWPEFSPEMGANSLHQAIYYVRRIFDPGYREGISAGYLTFDGEVITLDPELVISDSSRCWRLLRSTGAPDVVATEEIVALYQGRFAIDFTYEEWSAHYRETLHAAVLGRVEAAMAMCAASSDLERGIGLGTSILRVDPDADAIELALLRAYKAAGRHAAAAEQYAHYASTLRHELGVEPPSYDSI
jgi:LuxR family maltose regulon positive regulatory protein